jgi:hypothetical protein
VYAKHVLKGSTTPLLGQTAAQFVNLAQRGDSAKNQELRASQLAYFVPKEHLVQCQQPETAQIALLGATVVAVVQRARKDVEDADFEPIQLWRGLQALRFVCSVWQPVLH